MNLRPDQYDKLRPHRDVIRAVAERGINISNSPHVVMNEVWVDLGQAPANLSCNACILQLFTDINNLCKLYELTLFNLTNNN